MAITVTINDNPTINDTGTLAADAVTISSGYSSGVVDYDIQRYSDTTDEIYISSDATYDDNWPQVVSCTNEEAQVILAFRTEYKVRVRQNDGDWSDWTTFITRDKLYSSPAACDSAVAVVTYNSAGASVTVTNEGKAPVTYSSAGASVTNTDYQSNGVTAITDTGSGVTVQSS